MRIAVCIKQVPADGNVKMDEKTGVLIRGTGEARINPYDKVALETAIRLKEKRAGK